MRLLFAMLGVLSLSVICFGAPATQHTDDETPIQKMVRERVDAAETELAASILARSQVAPQQLAKYDVGIDLRIISRWWLLRCDAADTFSPDQIAAYLRADTLQRAIPLVDRALASTDALSPSQINAATRLHQITFTLDQMEAPSKWDGASHDLGLLLVNITSANPVTTLSPARPKPLPQHHDQPATDADSDEPAPLGIGELTDQIRQTNVGAGLRAQLLELSKQAEETGKSDKSEDGTRLLNLLRDTTAMAQGLAANTAVAPEERIKLESQLAESIALALDPRLKSIGEQRLKSMDQYRQMLTRMGKLKLNPQQRQQLRAAFTWAQEHPKESTQILSAIEAYDKQMTRAAAPAEPPAKSTYAPALTMLKQRFATTAGQFVQDANNLGGTFGVEPKNLDDDVKKIQQTLDLQEMLTQLPAAVDTLSAQKPGAARNLEHRVALAANAAAANNDTAARTDAETYLSDLTRLAVYADQLVKTPLDNVPPAVVKDYTHDKLIPFKATWKTLIAQQVDAAASTGKMDSLVINRLDQFNQLATTLVDISARAQKTVAFDVLMRWADWGIDQSVFDTMIYPLSQHTAVQFEAVVSGRDINLADWKKTRRHYEPLLALIDQDSAYVDAVKQMPDDLTNIAAQLATPYAQQPFATERLLSFGFPVWTWCDKQGDTANADDILIYIARAAAKEMGIPFKEHPSGKLFKKN